MKKELPNYKIVERIEELERKFDALVYQLKRIANITIIFEEDKDE